MSATDLTPIAQTILDVAAAALDEIPDFDPALLGAPERILRTPGLPVDDCCEQLAVHVSPITRFSPSRDNRQTGWLNSVQFTLTLGRCVPVIQVVSGKPKLPTVDELEAAADQINADGWAMWNGLNHAILRDGALPESCGKAAIGPLTARDPSGGCGGWTIEIVLTVDGYQPQGPES